jgi:dienelactone hydrolase
MGLCSQFFAWCCEARLRARASGVAGAKFLRVAGLIALYGLWPEAAVSQSYEKVSFRSNGAGGANLSGYLFRPQASAPVPVVITLHGCGGLLTRSGDVQKRERDWARRIVAWGYAALFVDSFNPRGFREVCTLGEDQRAIRPRDRAEDVAAAIAWIRETPTLDPRRIALVGWSHGGSATLWSSDRRISFAPTDLRAAVAFYPGCRPMAASAQWAPRVPLAILIGGDDDWTRPEPCRALARKHPEIRYIEYPGAVHGFDTPDLPVRVREGIGLVGKAKIGTHPQARAEAIAEVERLLKAALE